MLREPGAEAVFDEVVGTGDEAERVRRDDQVQVSGAAAHGAVAVEDVEVGRREDLEPHAAAVAGTGVPDGRAGAQVRGAFHGGASSCAR